MSFLQAWVSLCYLYNPCCTSFSWTKTVLVRRRGKNKVVQPRGEEYHQFIDCTQVSWFSIRFLRVSFRPSACSFISSPLVLIFPISPWHFSFQFWNRWFNKLTASSVIPSVVDFLVLLLLSLLLLHTWQYIYKLTLWRS